MIERFIHPNSVRLELPHFDLAETATQLRRAGYFVATVDRAPVFNKETLMHALYQSGRFPAYFGFNWDAVADCLTDFSWMEAKGYFLVFNDWFLLESEAPDEAKMLLEVAAEAQKVWQGEGKPFALVICTN